MKQVVKKVLITGLITAMLAGNIDAIPVQAAGSYAVETTADEKETDGVIVKLWKQVVAVVKNFSLGSNSIMTAMDYTYTDTEEREQLKALVEKAYSLKESDYTAESWAIFVEARDAIESVDDVADIPDQFIQANLTNLQDAMDQLKPAKAESDERKQLKALIEKADKLNESDYTAESWAEFKDTRDSIDNVDEIPDKFVGTVLQNLQDAIDQLKPAKAESDERKQLKALIEKADKLNESDYTAESWAEFKDTRDSIDNVDEIPDQFVGTVLQNLQDVMDQLKPAKSESDERKQLKALIEKADKLNESDYTAESWAEFKDTRDSIEDVDEIPEQFVGTVLKNLQDAMDQLEPAKAESEERKQLKALIEKADKLNESDYTAESWAEFKEVRDAIEDVDAIPDKYVSTVLQNLQDAMDGLKKAEDNTKLQLDDGYYIVNLTCGMLQKGNLLGKYSTGGISETALITAKNHKYTVTMSAANESKIEYFDILDNEYDSKDNYTNKLGTKGWTNDTAITDSKKYAEAVRNGAIEANDKYWLDINYQKDEKNVKATISFPIEDLEKQLVVYETLSGNYDGAASRIYKDYLTIDTQNAMKLNKDIVSTSGKISYTISGNNESMFTTETAEWNVTDNVGTAKYVIDTTWLEKHSQNIRWIKDDAGNDIDLSKGYVELTYNLDDYTSLACGRTIMYREINGDNIDDCMITFIPKTGEITQVSLVDEETGTKLETTSDIVNPNASLISEKIVDDPDNKEDPYDCLMANISGLYKNYYMATYKIQYKNGSKLIDTSKKVTLKFKIPDDWDENQVQLATFIDDLGTKPNVSGTVEKTEDGNYFVISTNKLGHYALYEKKTTQDADELENGTYTIPVSVYHLTNEGQLSMANRCLGGSAELVVEDGIKTLYMDFTSVENMSLTSYMTKMWIYGEDMQMEGNTPKGSLVPVVFTSYYKNADGSYLTDSFNAGTINYYPKSGYVQLVSDKAQWPARFKVPIMDAIGGGNFEQDAWLTLDWANAKKTSDDTQEPQIKNALRELLAIKQTATQTQYTDESWSNLESAYTSAQATYNTESSTQQDLTKAYVSLRTALDSLEDKAAPELAQGVYVATGALDSTDIVTDTRFVIGADNKQADIYLKVNGITNFTYYDVNEKDYKAVTLETVTDDDGNETVTGVQFHLAVMANSVTVKYTTTDGQERDGLLSFASMERQEVSKAVLQSVLEKAQEKIKAAAADPERYDAQAKAALDTAIAAALEVKENPVALQDEIDAQVQALNTAIDALTLNVSKEDLQKAIATAEAKNEASYTSTSWSALKTTLEEAKILLNKEGLTTAEADAMALKLGAAIEALVEKASDWSAFNAAYEKAAAITNENEYPGWEALQAVLADAKALKESQDATQIQVDSMTQALNAAVSNLYGTVDKSQLKILIQEIEAQDFTDCTKEAQAALTAALASAQATVDNAKANQNEIEKQWQFLRALSQAMVEKTSDSAIADGVYTINGKLHHASADQDSMGNAALKKPLQVEISTDKETGERTGILRMEFGPMKTAGFTGYLAELSYYPGWAGGDNGYTMPSDKTPASLTVESYYDVYDSYNDPDNGTDESVKGKQYPHIMSMPLDFIGDDEIWVQVYVPVMESINKGGGRQYAKLQLDWDSLTQIRGADTDKSELEALIESASKMEQGNASDESYAALQSMLAYARSVDDDMNAGQDVVEAVTNALQMSVYTLTEDKVKADKSELAKAIEVADSYLNAEDVVFTDSTKKVLQDARDAAAKVYADENATQTEVNRCVEAIDNAINGLIRVGADKSGLAAIMNRAQDYLKATDQYTAASIEALRSAYDTAYEVYQKKDATQNEVDAQVRVIDWVLEHMIQVSEQTTEKSGLHDLLLTAANMSGREQLYTSASITALKKAVQTAEKVYDDEDATQQEINEQCSALVDAIMNLTAKTDNNNNTTPTPNPGQDDNNNGNNNNGNNNNNNNNGSGSGTSTTDRYNLADGVYLVTGKMQKVDKSSESMSNAAINHNIKLTVKNGKYYLTMDFCGLKYAGQYGYLAQLKYFKTGYGTDKYGNPTGSLTNVTVDSVQKDSSGKVISDSYGSNYPNLVTFPLISEALKDGYVPLQVFVPVMESISAGTGTQPVFLKLSWSSLEKTTSNDSAFDDKSTTNDTTSDDSDDDSSSLLNFKSTLKSSTLGTTSLKSASLSSGASALKSSASALKKSGTTALKSTALEESAATLNSVLDGDASAIESAATLTSGGDAYTAGSYSETTEQSADGGAPLIPIGSSIFVLLAGILYKLKSRGLLALR